MREILFRAWDSSLEKMFYINGCSILEIVKASNECEDEFWFNESEDVWLQYTGLKDKNGKKIFEGDIIYNYSNFRYSMSDKPHTYSVIFKDGSFMFESINGKRVSHQYWPGEMIKPDNWEVIGNIYENPELLKK